jgi:hypothetical protein
MYEIHSINFIQICLNFHKKATENQQTQATQIDKTKKILVCTAIYFSLYYDNSKTENRK